MKTLDTKHTANALKKLQGSTKRAYESSFNSYAGISMFCDIKLHETCFDLIQQINNNPGDLRILILGSGGGAFDQRLFDAGYTNITSTDFRTDFFKAKGPKFVECDLNLDFTHLGVFDIIVGIEVIEHLENTAHFMRNVVQCLSRDGVVIITTPNVESGLSRANFLVTGHLSFFTNADLQGSGHITPIFDHLFRFHATNAGLTVVSRIGNRNAWVARYSATYNECAQHLKHPVPRNLLRIITLMVKSVSIFFWPLTRFHSFDGNINIYTLKKENSK